MQSLYSAARRVPWCVVLLVMVCCGGCSKASQPTGPTVLPAAEPSSPVSPGDLGPATLVGAGDIGLCGSPGVAATAALLDRYPGTVIAVGDNAYMAGTLDEYQRCYDPTWGRQRSRTRPVPGNHEYERGSAGEGYFSYFGATAGAAGSGYYSYRAGAWQVVALNSEISSAPGSPQLEWLRQELSAHPSACTAVYWHRPLFSSGKNGDNADMRPVWRTLYEFNVDLVINGHDHSYERFAPQDPDGRLDTARGIREIVVGTGGATLYEFANIRPNSESRGSVWGVGVFTLLAGSYRWEFVPVEGASFRDSGSGTCH